MNILHGALKGEIENKIETFTNIVYNVSIQRFGVVERRKTAQGQRQIFANCRKKTEIGRDLKHCLCSGGKQRVKKRKMH